MKTQKTNNKDRPRCVTTRELHVQMAECIGISLDELQARCDLSKIGIEGAGIESVRLRQVKSNYHGLFSDIIDSSLWGKIPPKP